MVQPTPQSKTPPPLSSGVKAVPQGKPLSQAAIYCDRAMAMMNSLRIMPTPQYYSIFFAYAAGQPTPLVKEIDKALNEKLPFNEELLDYLHASYIADPQAQVMRDTAANAKRILAEIMSSVSVFTGVTNAVSDEVNSQLQSMDEELSEEVVRLLADTLVQGAQKMKDSSEGMAQRLAGAQQEIADLRENLARAMTEAERDFLTGTFNRKAFDKRLNDAMITAKNEETELALLMLDIDHFKHFNDNFGHLIGDEVLKIVAKTLTDTLKGTDCVARYGGEEFAILLPKTPIGGGMIVAESIRKNIASKELKRKSTGENFGVITVSIGVAAFRHNDDSPSNFISRADEALYRSKNSGRNRVTQENISR